MAITRSEVLEIFKLFLEEKVSQERVYEWALAQVVAKDYDEAAKKDPLLRETLQALIDINHDDVEFIPTRKDLEYYFLCLSGQQSFVPQAVRREESKKRQQQKQQQQRREKFKAAQTSLIQTWLSIDKKVFYAVVRIYVRLFAIISLTVNVLGILKPELFRPAAEAARAQAFVDAMPHLIYAGLLLLPRRILTQGILFYAAALVFLIAAVFYWYVTIVLVVRFDLHIFLLVLFAPFAGLPAFLALWLLWKDKKNQNRRRYVAQRAF